MENREYNSVIKYGKGKKAVPVLGIQGYETQAGKLYRMVHVNTNTCVMDGYFYLSQCRKLGHSIAETFGDVFCLLELGEINHSLPREVYQYLLFYRFSKIKEPLSYEDFINGPDYEDLLNRERDSIDAERLRTEHARELSEGDITLAWVPKETGELRGDDLECLIEGRRTYSERFYPEDAQ